MTLTQDRLNTASKGFRALTLTALIGSGTPQWQMLAMETSSTGASEEYEFLLGIPRMKEMVGSATLQNISNAGFTIENKEFDATVSVKRKHLERDNLGLYTPMFQEMGASAREYPTELVAEVLGGGFTTTDWTRKNFFDTAKKLNPDEKGAKAVTFTNKLTAALDTASFVEARAMLKTMTDIKGNNLKLGKKLILVVPPALEHTALKLRNAEKIGDESNVLKGTFEVEVLNELTVDTHWFLMEGGRPIKPIIVQYEVKPEFSSSDRVDSDRMIIDKEALYQVYARMNVKAAMPQFIIGSTGAG